MLVVPVRVSGPIYLKNDVYMVSSCHLKRMSVIGDQTRKELVKEGIWTIRDVVTKMKDEKVRDIMKESKLKLPLLLELVRMCSSVIQTNAPKKKDHTQHENPY